MQPTPSGDPIDPNEPVLELPQTYYAPPAYAPPYFGPAGYTGYGPVPSDGRPGQGLAAAILALIAAALLLVTGFIIIFAASSLDTNSDFESSDRTTAFVLAGLGNVIAASLLIIGAVLMLGRSRGARMGIVLGALVCIALGIFWLTEQADNGGVVVWLFIFCGPAVVAALLTLSSSVTAWLNADR